MGVTILALQSEEILSEVQSKRCRVCSCCQAKSTYCNNWAHVAVFITARGKCGNKFSEEINNTNNFIVDVK